MPPAWLLSIIRGPFRKAEILLDTTCFSTTELDNFVDCNTDSDTDSDVDSHYPIFDLVDPTNMSKKATLDPDAHAEVYRRKALSNNALDTKA